MNDPFFTENGSELFCTLTGRSYRVLSWKPGTMGLSAVVEASRDGQPLFRDAVKLWTMKNREGFEKRCSGEVGIAVDLCRIEDELKRYLQSSADKPAPGQNLGGEIPEPLKKEAVDVLHDPALLFKVGTALESLGLIGEKRNALVLYLAMTSRLLMKPISLAIKASSSAGKSFLVDSVLRLFPREAFLLLTGMSRQALVYLQESFAHRMIVVTEAAGMENAEYNVRVLLSEHRLIFHTVEKDKVTNEMRTVVKEKDGPSGLVTTTTAPRLHPENETRIFTIAVDESPEQTRRVLRATAAGYEEKRAEIPDLALWKALQQLLQPVRVVIPFADDLAKIIPDRPLRMRRDFARLLASIEVSALLHQHQRRSLQIGDQRVIEADLRDYYIARALFEETFHRSLTGGHPNIRKIVQIVQELSKDHPEGWVETRKIVERGWRKPTITRWMKPAVDEGWVEADDPGKGKPKSYRPGRAMPEELDQTTLPSVDILAERFPRLALDFEVIDPITGKSLKMEQEEMTSAAVD